MSIMDLIIFIYIMIYHNICIMNDRHQIMNICVSNNIHNIQNIHIYTMIYIYIYEKYNIECISFISGYVDNDIINIMYPTFDDQ